jgi:hypothetical protein
MLLVLNAVGLCGSRVPLAFNAFGLRGSYVPLAPNATLQARRTAEARDERTLFAVACKRLFGWVHSFTALPLRC